jgi:hypothetical protein
MLMNDYTLMMINIMMMMMMMIFMIIIIGDNYVLIMIYIIYFSYDIAGNSVVMKPSEMTSHVMLPFILYIMIYIYYDYFLSILVM